MADFPTDIVVHYARMCREYAEERVAPLTEVMQRSVRCVVLEPETSDHSYWPARVTQLETVVTLDEGKGYDTGRVVSEQIPRLKGYVQNKSVRIHGGFVGRCTYGLARQVEAIRREKVIRDAVDDGMVLALPGASDDVPIHERFQGVNYGHVVPHPDEDQELFVNEAYLENDRTEIL